MPGKYLTRAEDLSAVAALAREALASGDQFQMAAAMKLYDEVNPDVPFAGIMGDLDGLYDQLDAACFITVADLDESTL